MAGTFLGTQVPDLEDRPLCQTGAHWAVGQHVDVKNHPTVMIACSPQQIFAECPPSPGPGGARGRGRCCLTLAGWVSVVPSAIEWALRTPHQAMLKRDLGRNHQSLQSFSMALCGPRGCCRSKRSRDLSRGPQELIPGELERRRAHSTVWHRPSQKECCGSRVSTRMCTWSSGVCVKGRF